MTDEGWPTLTEATVRELSRAKSYERGQSYYEQGAVGDVVRRGETVRADVEGSQYQPYTVTIDFDDAGVAGTDCSCPYDHGGICKHRVAVLLTCLRDPERVRTRPPMSELVAEAERETLEALLVEFADSHPEVADRIETRLTTSDETTTDTALSVNVESIRRRVQHALPKPGQPGHQDGYAEAERMAEELDDVLEQARMAIEAGDGATALEILTAIAEELATGNWTGLLPYDALEVYEAIGDLAQTFTEAILTADLTTAEREALTERFDEWDQEFRHYMGEPTFSTAEHAATRGWDHEHLQQALAGDLDEGEFAEAEAVVAARLAVLDRENRIEEYLNLAAAANQPRAYATMLVQQGRIEQAVDYAIDRFSTPEALLDLAQTLRTHEETEAALQVAQPGLALEGHRKDALAEWVRDRAASTGDHDLALEAAITAFETSPSVSTYEAVAELAGDDWASVKTDLLASLRATKPRSIAAGQAVEVFLREGAYDDAIELAEQSGRTDVIEPVVEAAVEERPQWVIETCKSQAEPIIEQGQHDRYRTAVRWLRRAGEAARAADELDEWRAYVETIRDDHYRKYKLRPMLDDLLDEV